MKYVNAFSLFPKKIASELQKTYKGHMFISHKRKVTVVAGGELTGWRTQVEKRNMRIREDFHRGISIETLAETYFLSEHTIKNIVYKK